MNADEAAEFVALSQMEDRESRGRRVRRVSARPRPKDDEAGEGHGADAGPDE